MSIHDERRLAGKIEPVKVYVGCSLTHASEAFKGEVSRLKAELKKSCIVLEFLGLSDGTCRDVWNHDIKNCVMQCDLLIAVCDHASTGLGVEIGVQTMCRKGPTLAVAHRDAVVTRLILDPDVEGHYEVLRYVSLMEILPRALELVGEIRMRKGAQLVLDLFQGDPLSVALSS